MKIINFLLGMVFTLSSSAYAWQWLDLWQIPDQQGMKLLQEGKPQQAARTFKDIGWQAVAYYRSGLFDRAFKQFSTNKTSDGLYNAGNAAAFMERYQEAITAYDQAIALNANNSDAIFNREIIKKLLQQKKQENQAQKNNSSSNNEKKEKNNQVQQDNSKKNLKQNHQSNNNAQKNADNKPDTHLQPSAARAKQKQDENNQQLLRSIPDESGSLLQAKFLRDYMRRHGMADD